MSCWLFVRLTCKGTRGRSPGRSTGRGRWRPLWTGKAHTAAWWSGRRHWWLCETSEQQQQQSQHTQHLDLQTEMWRFPFSFSTWKQKSISTSCLRMKMIINQKNVHSASSARSFSLQWPRGPTHLLFSLCFGTGAARCSSDWPVH